MYRSKEKIGNVLVFVVVLVLCSGILFVFCTKQKTEDSNQKQDTAPVVKKDDINKVKNSTQKNVNNQETNVHKEDKIGITSDKDAELVKSISEIRKKLNTIWTVEHNDNVDLGKQKLTQIIKGKQRLSHLENNLQAVSGQSDKTWFKLIGKMINFSNSVIDRTSNLHPQSVQDLHDELSALPDNMEDALKQIKSTPNFEAYWQNKIKSWHDIKNSAQNIAFTDEDEEIIAEIGNGYYKAEEIKKENRGTILVMLGICKVYALFSK